MKTQKPQNSKNNLEKRNKAGGITLPVQSVLKAIIIKQYSTGTHKN